ncbi:MAG: hypothetical protein AB7O52_10405 [Planctomycetota bacterium]
MLKSTVRYPVVGLLSLALGAGCVSADVREGASLGLHTTWGPLLQTWRHLAAGGSGFAELGGTYSHLRRGQGFRYVGDTFAHIAADAGREGPVDTFFGHFIGPYDFASLSNTLDHLR